MPKPLSDVRVLDLGQIYQGGYCGMILSYMGADVVKVEPPWGENVRTRSKDKKPPQFQFLNPNKRGITVNLKTERGRELLRELACEADVLLENYSTGTMDSLGVGYEDLREENPALIYAHGSGYGDDGPYADYPAMDLTIQAMSGVMSTTGFPDSPPVKSGAAVCDIMGGIHLVVGILGALFERERTGEGQYVEVGMYDAMYPTLASSVSAWVSKSDAPERTGNRHSGHAIAPYNAYEVEDGYVVIICIAERHWENLTRLMGREDLLGVEKYSTKYRRAEHIDEIDAHIEEWLDGREKAEVVTELLDAGVPGASVKTIAELVDDPHLRHRQMLNYLPNQSEGRDKIPVPGMPIKFSESEPPEVTPAPTVGEHTDEVLTELLSYSLSEIEQLHAEDAL